MGIDKKLSYFNSGMLLMDLNFIRQNNVYEKLLKDISINFENYSLVDQDALNKFYKEITEYLPWQYYNCPCIPFYTNQPETDNSSEILVTYKEIAESQKAHATIYDNTNHFISMASIIHFCTIKKPWKDKEYYQQENMKEAYKIYNRYERLLDRLY